MLPTYPPRQANDTLNKRSTYGKHGARPYFSTYRLSFNLLQCEHVADHFPDFGAHPDEFENRNATWGNHWLVGGLAEGRVECLQGVEAGYLV